MNKSKINTIQEARKLVDKSIIRLEYIKKRLENSRQKYNIAKLNKANMLLAQYYEFDKRIKQYEYN